MKPRIPNTLAGIVALGERLNRQNARAVEIKKLATTPGTKAKWNKMPLRDPKRGWGKFDAVLNERFQLHWTWIKATDSEALVKLLKERK